MELSGLIFVALAVVWAAVLLPKALRHHDEVAQTRSVDSVSDAVRVLTPRTAVEAANAAAAVPGPRTPAPAAPARPVTRPVLLPGPRRPVDRAVLKTRAETRRRAAATAARRRRWVLGVLLLASAGVGGATALSPLPLWSLAVPVALTLLFLVVARVTVRRANAAWDAELTSLRAALRDAATEGPAAPVAAAPPAPNAPVTSQQGLAVVSGLDDTSSTPVALLTELDRSDASGSLWDPLPVTLPTYVTKPRATRSVRTIDLNAPDVSSSGRDAAASALVAEAATAPGAEVADARAVGS